ncbi:MAG: hypothetical protein HY706_02285 [Candidatus Hydrogenedentes bacterium]|nr:hypothetical protein [Candidatus Hydrogenedentota bacterium]
MSGTGPVNAFGIYLRLVTVGLFIFIAIIAGLWVGKVTSPVPESSDRNATTIGGSPIPDVATPENPPYEPPLFFFVNTGPTADLGIVAEELAMAAANGIVQFVISVPLSWNSQQPEREAVLQRLRLVMAAQPKAKLLLYIRLDAPAEWLTAHPESVVTFEEQKLLYASPASSAWQQDASAALARLIGTLRDSEMKDQIVGYVLAALEEGRWSLDKGHDVSPENVTAFRHWLHYQYPDDAKLREAWDNTEVELDSAPIPPRPENDDTRAIFFAGADRRAQEDFRRYASQSTAAAIEKLGASVKEAAGRQALVIVPYGYSFESQNNESGHFALMRLLESPHIDGFVGPVSYFDRGLGDAGGFAGPIDSVLRHKKQWFVMDDTRTGIAKDPASGVLTHMAGLQPEDVYNVQRRNFAAAVTHGAGLWWTDLDGTGSLHDAEMWKRFGAMREIYRKLSTPDATDSAEAPASGVYDIKPSERPTLAVVVDEESRFYQQCSDAANTPLLLQARDAAIGTGVPTQFYLLEDVLSNHVPPATVYLFVNAFHLPRENREKLHATLKEQKATALWLYASGYFDETPSEENISATTHIKVKAFDKPARAGSVYDLAGRWLNKDDTFGTAEEWQPLFYIDEEKEDTNILAKYAESGRTSVAMEFLEAGWTSVYIAEPGLSANLLREILQVLELPIYSRKSHMKFLDAMYFGPNLLAIHAKDTGERLMDLGWIYDIQDLFDPRIGWPQKRTFTVPLKSGETLLLKLKPAASEEAP